MKTTQSSGTRPVHQTVAGEFNFKCGGKAIAVAFTDQRLSPHAGSATFWGWLHPSGWINTLAAALPHAPSLSNNKLPALVFMQGLLCEARKLTHIAYEQTVSLAKFVGDVVPAIVRISGTNDHVQIGINFPDFRGGFHAIPARRHTDIDEGYAIRSAD